MLGGIYLQSIDGADRLCHDLEWIDLVRISCWSIHRELAVPRSLESSRQSLRGQDIQQPELVVSACSLTLHGDYKAVFSCERNI